MIWLDGKECSEGAGKVCIVIQTLYVLNSAASSWHAELVGLFCNLGYFSMKADPDVWIPEAVCDDGFNYFEMLIIHVDDILSISHKAKERIDGITMHYAVKNGSIKEPTLYLGANVGKMQLEDGHKVWYTSFRSYVNAALDIVQHLLDDDGEGYSLKLKVKNPFPSGYHPSLT
jgi:hypothetical protein